jgi:hypothetical protein
MPLRLSRTAPSRRVQIATWPGAHVDFRLQKPICAAKDEKYCGLVTTEFRLSCTSWRSANVGASGNLFLVTTVDPGTLAIPLVEELPARAQGDGVFRRERTIKGGSAWGVARV